MTNPDRDAVDREPSQGSAEPASDGLPSQQARRKPIIRNEARAAQDALSEADPADPAHRKVKPRRPDAKVLTDLSGKQQIQGKHSGDRYVRVVRPQGEDFERAGPGHLVATEEANAARGSFSRGYMKVKRVLIGAPLSTASAAHERLTKAKALAVLSSDALSSVAYATEEILRVLLVAGGLAVLDVSLPIGAAIIAAPDHRRHLLPADDQGLSPWRRQLHRGQGQPRRWSGAGRRRRAARGLYVDSRRLHRRCRWPR